MSISLRPVTLDDGKLIVEWRNNPRILAHCLNQKPITPETNERFFHETVETGHYKQYIAEQTDEDYGDPYPIATVYLKEIDVTNRRCELCVITNANLEWNTESHAEALRLLLEKAFDEMGMHKVYSYVFYSFLNEASLLKRAGFQMEAIFRDEIVDLNGEYQDIVRFSITEEEWKKVKNRK